MATEYVDPNTVHNPTTGQVIPASWGDVVRDNGEALVDPPAASVYHNTTQSLTTATSTVLSANSELFDNDSMHSTVTNNSRLTIQKAGRYLFATTVGFAANGSGERNVEFIVNGTDVYQGTAVAPNPSGSRETNISVTRAIVCSAADYVEVRARQASGGALNCTLHEFFGYRITR